MLAVSSTGVLPAESVMAQPSWNRERAPWESRT
jgi:hypothetical protein